MIKYRCVKTVDVPIGVSHAHFGGFAEESVLQTAEAATSRQRDGFFWTTERYSSGWSILVETTNVDNKDEWGELAP